MTEWKMPTGVYSITPRQLECLQVICEWQDKVGRSPSYSELASEMETGGKGAAHWLVVELEERGWVRTERQQRSSIEVLHRPPMPDFGEIEWSRAESLATGADGGQR